MRLAARPALSPGQQRLSRAAAATPRGRAQAAHEQRQLHAVDGQAAATPRGRARGRRLLALHLLVMLGAATAGAQEPTVNVRTSREVYLGQPFIYRVDVGGTDQVAAPESGPLGSFEAALVSAGPNNSESIVTVNNRTTRTVRRGYVLRYRLTATASGLLTIPPLNLQVDGAARTTPAVTVEVREPEEVPGYRLQLALERSAVWVGEPVLLTTSWLWAEELGPRRLNWFSHPIFASGGDGVTHELRRPRGSADDLLTLEVAGAEVVARRDAARVDGHPFVGLTFQGVLVADRGGALRIPAATVAFEGVAGYRRGRAVLRQLVIPSNELTLEVKPLPAAGRPDQFSGLVGRFQVRAAAAPAEVKVGDPLELEVTVTGTGDLRRLAAPDLAAMPGFEAFRVSAHVAPRAVFGRAVFRYTLRALHDQVSAVPPVRISVFDSAAGAYREVASGSIQLAVQATRQVTLQDVEGADPDGAGGGAPVVGARAGIAHNYHGPMLLANHRVDPAWWRSPRGLAALLAGPLLIGAVHAARGLHAYRRRGSRRRRYALASLRRVAGSADGAAADSPALLAALRIYLQDRFQLPAPPHGYGDVRGPLQAAGVGEPDLEALAALFGELEATRYGGRAAAATDLAHRLTAWAARIEEGLR